MLSASCTLAADFPKAELFGGYQYTHLEGGNDANGWNLAVTGNVSNWFGVAFDLSDASESRLGLSLTNYTYTVGPVFRFVRRRLTRPSFMCCWAAITLRPTPAPPVLPAVASR
jgi:hypothetical protein